MKGRQTSKKQHSKQWIDRWQYFVMFWVSVFNIADIYFNKAEHLLELNITLVTSIVATIVPFLCKSYFETKQQKLMEMMQNENMEGEVNE